MAADYSNGYILNFDVYLGKEVDGRRRIYGLGYDVVTMLIRPYTVLCKSNVSEMREFRSLFP